MTHAHTQRIKILGPGASHGLAPRGTATQSRVAGRAGVPPAAPGTGYPGDLSAAAGASVFRQRCSHPKQPHRCWSRTRRTKGHVPWGADHGLPGLCPSLSRRSFWHPTVGAPSQVTAAAPTRSSVAMVRVATGQELGSSGLCRGDTALSGNASKVCPASVPPCLASGGIAWHVPASDQSSLYSPLSSYRHVEEGGLKAEP